ncbi:dicarboxylate/amino acid:cation symporter [Porticoccus sp.]|uniref:dicarboxylate/amino acid:cation symporter n=1 Tax=Porticoccus sp. TaxID=2024853 RepID=UPI000C486476|nr:dicarboxylate/amino acid:cation symporter [Porticoccus sp.]MAZ70024.1 dicarboxylate/amino acid:cation symporter [Porticoccus sp.]
MGKLKLHWQMLIAILAAVVIGLLFDIKTTLLGVSLYSIFDFIGMLFLNALKMLIVPLVMSSIIVGIAGLGGSDNLGRLGAKTVGFYLCSSLLAILIGLLLVNLLSPGVIDGEAAGSRLNLSEPEAVSSQLVAVEGRGVGDITGVFLRMVPPNIVKAAADGQMLGLIFFSLLFGVFMTRISKEPAQTLLGFWNGVYETMMEITLFIMKFAPLGVLGLVAKTILATGFDAFQPLMMFFITVVLALAVHTFVTLALVLRLAGLNPLKHYRAMLPAMLTAFSTASSSGTLPVTIECVEKNAGVSNRTSAFVLPLGATINMDGTALYECVAAIFIAQAYGLELSFVTQFTIVLVALLTSIGVAGIPSASLVAITVILGVIGLPLEAIGMLLVTDRILDMLRTSVNVFSDSCGAVVIARSEGEQGLLV